MIITITGDLGSGKSTVAKILAGRLGYKHYSTGDFMREMAKERHIDLMELSRCAESDKSIDRDLDKRQIRLGKEEDDFIIDARLGWHFIPNSVKIFLRVEDREAARRIFKDQRPEETKYMSSEETLESIRKRKESELKRYMEYYGIDYTDETNYDLVLDTTKIPAEKVAEKILEFLERK